MTVDNGQTGTDVRAEEIAGYVTAVREALADLPAAIRDELVEDLRAHLSEVTAEEERPLRDLLGPPGEYAAELRTAVDPERSARSGAGTARIAELVARTRARLQRLDTSAGPLLGYPTVSEFGRLLGPAWWVLRGYLTSMIVVIVLNEGSAIGLLPRLGGSTLAGVVILAAFVAGSVWLGRRTPGLGPWPRRTVQTVSAMVLLFGILQLLSFDTYEPLAEANQTTYYYENPYGDVADVYVIDRDGRLLRDVRLVDQNGLPIDIGWADCDNRDGESSDEQAVPTYPRCPDDLPWWLEHTTEPLPSQTATPAPTSGTTPAPSRTG